MNKSELIQAIADEAAFVSVVTQELKDGKDVTLVGFGTFHAA